MNTKIKKIISEALIEMMDDKVSLNLLRKNKVPLGNILFNGFFSEKPLEFFCAMAKPQKEWVPVFLHEYCHYKQWKEGSAIFGNLSKIGGALWNWIEGGIELKQKDIETAINITRSVELDCEKRVVNLVEKHSLDFVDIRKYIKAANSYILFYTLLLKTRKWYVKAPYECEEVLGTVPSKFLENYDILPDNYELMVLKNCY